ncbi:pentatricopeptide repeat-containing protein At5g39350 [Andrographis paniculata]|uniref:pentatricopeptide repeat-containing protein At5g39350 n=1 Tax=Andrographis paniculata TaxID=175694 RepID=UPI0021E7ABBC|nr:pentatricopeptide repeat-containing protein At5g39350 [Andrographis paniculata]
MVAAAGRGPPLPRALSPVFSTAVSQYESLLHRCATAGKSLATTEKLHGRSITFGLISNYILSLLTSAYALCGHLPYARKLFDELPKKTAIACKSMIRMYAENGRPRDALHLFVETRACYSNTADEYTYPFVLRACRDLAMVEVGMVIHGLTIKSGSASATFVRNSLLAMYMSCGDREGASRVFAAMETKTAVSWNTMISGCFRNGSAKEALMVFDAMVESDADAIDSVTALSALPACGHLKDLQSGRRIHRLVESKGITKRIAVQNALIDMYVKCGEMDSARGVFDGMAERDVVTWTSVINGYISVGDTNGALEMFGLMQVEGVTPNEVTLASLTAMCAASRDLNLGKCLHGWTVRREVECDVNVETALIDMYAKCGRMNLSLRVFNTTSKKDTTPWSAIFSGYIHNKMAAEAIDLFKLMQREGTRPDEATWKSLLPAYAVEADMRRAMSIHGYLLRSGFVGKPDIITTLMDIYAKCGCLRYAHDLFDALPAKNRDIVAWSVIIAGYGKHGQGQLVLSLFDRMVESGVEPNEITFTSVLHACGHAGLVNDGLKLFEFMQRKSPEILRMDHYTCIVDLLGRAGRVEEAYAVIRSMGFEPSHAVWGALLGACAIHENVELGEVAAGWLFKLEPENTGNYVLMGNIYSAAGRFGAAEEMRRMMDGVGLIKAPANSVAA